MHCLLVSHAKVNLTDFKQGVATSLVWPDSNKRMRTQVSLDANHFGPNNKAKRLGTVNNSYNATIHRRMGLGQTSAFHCRPVCSNQTPAGNVVCI